MFSMWATLLPNGDNRWTVINGCCGNSRSSAVSPDAPRKVAFQPLPARMREACSNGGRAAGLVYWMKTIRGALLVIMTPVTCLRVRPGILLAGCEPYNSTQHEADHGKNDEADVATR